MDKLQKDLTYFKLVLEGEANRERRMLIQTQIREILAKILELQREERARVQQENRFMEEALRQYAEGLPDSKGPDSDKPS